MGDPGGFSGGGGEGLEGANRFVKKIGGKISKIGNIGSKSQKKNRFFFFLIGTALELTLNPFKTKKSLRKSQKLAKSRKNRR